MNEHHHWAFLWAVYSVNGEKFKIRFKDKVEVDRGP